MKKKEWAIAIVLAILAITLSVFARDLNKKSFWEVSKILHVIKTKVGNLRKGPSTNHPIKVQMKMGDLVTPTNWDGNWLFGKHIGSSKEGWVHKGILRRYLQLGYYDELILDKSIFELGGED